MWLRELFVEQFMRSFGKWVGVAASMSARHCLARNFHLTSCDCCQCFTVSRIYFRVSDLFRMIAKSCPLNDYFRQIRVTPSRIKMALNGPQGTLRQQLLMMQGIASYCIILHCLALSCTVLHCLALSCITTRVRFFSC